MEERDKFCPLVLTVGGRREKIAVRWSAGCTNFFQMGPLLSILIELAEGNCLRIDAYFAKVVGERGSETEHSG